MNTKYDDIIIGFGKGRKNDCGCIGEIRKKGGADRKVGKDVRRNLH